LRDGKTNFKSLIYGHSSTNPANLMKIGSVDVPIVGLIEIVKKRAEHNSLLLCSSERAKIVI